MLSNIVKSFVSFIFVISLISCDGSLEKFIKENTNQNNEFVLHDVLSACIGSNNRDCNRLAGKWFSLRKKWIKECVVPAVSKYNIKLDCVKCSDFSIRIMFHLDEKGRLIKYDIIKTDWWCDGYAKSTKQAFINEILEYFKTVHFPAELKGLKIITALGYGPPC